MRTSIKVKFRPSAVPGAAGNIYYQIIHERKICRIVTSYRILPTEWIASRSTVYAPLASPRHALVLGIRQDIRADMERLNRITARLDAVSPQFSAQDIIDEFNRYATEYTLFTFMRSIIDRLKADGRIRTSETYHAALLSFRKFRQDRDLILDRLTPEIMEGYQAWLYSRGIVPNTASFYSRILRAVYNRAVRKGIVKDCYPFRGVYTGIDKTVKRALPIHIIKRICKLDLAATPKLDFARDMFMLSFYMRGMSFVDMAFLRKSDLRDGCVCYRRRKTGQLLSIAWTAEMQSIADKYPANTSQYLLPIIRDKNANERSVYHNMGYRINTMLKKVAAMAGVTIPLTLYVARHSWASAARAKGIPMAIISEGMGHDSELTTRIYLASLDTSLIDRANTLIINALK